MPTPATTPYLGLELHPSGTNNNPIINGNWQNLDTLAQKTFSRWIKTTSFNGFLAATTTFANPFALDLCLDKIIIVPTVLTAVTVYPNIEIGEDVGGTNTFATAFTPTFLATQMQEVTLLSPRPFVLNGGAFKVKLNSGASASAFGFEVWFKVLPKILA